MSKRKTATRRSRTEWLALLSEYEASGLDRAGFAVRAGLHPGTFSWWASRLLKERAALSKGDAPTSVTQELNAAKFVPVRVLTRGTTATSASSNGPTLSGAVEIVLVNGRRIRCDLANASDPRLATLLAIAESSSPC